MASPRCFMTDLPKTLNQRQAIKLMKAHGWTQSKGGKHVVKMIKPGHRPVTLPHHKGRDYSSGLMASILRQASLR